MERRFKSCALSYAAAALRRSSGLGLDRPTELINEAFLKAAKISVNDLGPDDPAGRWRDRSHFVRSLKETMKNLLIDAARRKNALRRSGGTLEFISSEEALEPSSRPDDTLFITDACEELARRDPMTAELAELHYVGGLTWVEAGALLDLSERVRKRMARRAKLWFIKELVDS